MAWVGLACEHPNLKKQFRQIQPGIGTAVQLYRVQLRGTAAVPVLAYCMPGTY
eukprot:SAG31_NODE_21_length_34109_cov_60.598824_21_plen_53_part_00